MPVLASKISLNRLVWNTCKYCLLKSHPNWLGVGGEIEAFNIIFGKEGSNLTDDS